MITAGASRVASGLLCVHAIAITPASSMELVRSSLSAVSGLPPETVRSAPAIVFSGPAQRSLTLRPARSRSRLASDPFHRKLQQPRCLRRRFDCFYEKVIKVKADVAAHLTFLVLCGLRHISTENFALGSLRNDDWQIDRPTAPPSCLFCAYSVICIIIVRFSRTTFWICFQPSRSWNSG